MRCTSRKTAAVLAVGAMLHVLAATAAVSRDYRTPAKKYGVDPTVLEGLCRYESGNGRKKIHHNKKGSWDVGLCQNHRSKRTNKRPRIPSDKDSIREGAKELAYWKKQHQRFCIEGLANTGSCGPVKNCRRNHGWFGHYNWGFRVLSNHYDQKVQCFINNGFKKCEKREWKKIRF